MTKYRNPRKEQENLEVDQIEANEELMRQPATTVEEENWKKRYGDIQRHLQSETNKWKSEVEALKNKLDQALRGQIKAPKSNEEVEAWVKEYPEFAGVLEAIIQSRINEATSSTTEKLASIERAQGEIEAEKAKLALKKLHPDFDELINSDEFHTWLGGQRQKYQDAMYNSLDVDEADFVISKYKAETKKNTKSKVDDDFSPASAAKVVRTSANVKQPVEDFRDHDFSESQIQRESKQNRNWYANNEEKIMEAARKGRILFDISGAAR